MVSNMQRGSLSRFCAELVLTSSLFTALYILAGAPYFRLIAEGANTLLAWVEAPYSAVVQSDGTWMITTRVGELRYERPVDDSAIHLLLLGAILLPALLLATPLRWRVRLRVCALGVLLLVSVQMIQVAIYLRSLGWEIPRTLIQESIVSIIYGGGTLIPVALWPLVALRPYLRGRRTQARRIEPARNAACPCGSGRKYKRCCAPSESAAC
jgi:hypothetical protein